MQEILSTLFSVIFETFNFMTSTTVSCQCAQNVFGVPSYLFG